VVYGLQGRLGGKYIEGIQSILHNLTKISTELNSNFDPDSKRSECKIERTTASLHLLYHQVSFGQVVGSCTGMLNLHHKVQHFSNSTSIIFAPRKQVGQKHNSKSVRSCNRIAQSLRRIRNQVFKADWRAEVRNSSWYVNTFAQKP
jgi:hypothetical protein